MRFGSPRVLAAGVTALVLLTGGATALAKSGSSPSDPSTPAHSSVTVTRPAADCGLPLPLDDAFKAAADYLGLSVEQFRNELDSGKSAAEIAREHGKSVDGLEQAAIDAVKADLDKRVAAGDVTAAEEQQMLGKLRSLIHDLVNRKDDGPGPLPKAPLGDPIQAAADYLGLSVDELAQQLKAGKSLADIAKAQGKSVDALEQAVLDAAKSDLDKSVAAGDMTAADEQQALSELRSQIDDFVNGTGALSIRLESGGVSVGIGGPASGLMVKGPYKTAADYLGLSVDQLAKELQAGKSLAEIATTHGKSVDGLKQALVAAETAQIEKAVDELVNQKGLPGPDCGAAVVKTGIEVAPGFGPSGKP